jgi:hypothetical protein
LSAIEVVKMRFLLGVLAYAAAALAFERYNMIPSCGLDCFNESAEKNTDCEDRDDVCMCKSLDAVLDGCGDCVSFACNNAGMS